MESLLFLKIGMLIAVSIIGWVIGRKWKMSSKDISTLLVYVVSPFVIFFDTRVSFKSRLLQILDRGISNLRSVRGRSIRTGKRFWSCGKKTFFFCRRDRKYGILRFTHNSSFRAIPVGRGIFIIIGVNIMNLHLVISSRQKELSILVIASKGAIATHYICNHFCSLF